MEFPENFTGFDASLGEMPRGRLANPAGATLTECHLNGSIAIRFRCLYLRDAIVRHIKHCHRDGRTIFGENARHADLASNKA
jgi:hypothetical protein